MDGESALRLAASVIIILANAFFVAAEYAIIGCRRSRIEALARRGSLPAKRAAAALKDTRKYIAGIQIAITMCGVLAGAVTEPFVTQLLSSAFGFAVDLRVSFVIAVVAMTFALVLIGELLPKYITLQWSERALLLLIVPLEWLVRLLYPLVWMLEGLGALLLRAFRIELGREGPGALPKDELLLLIRAQSAEGILDEMHAQMVAKALRFDKLTAADIMVHRMDVQWLDLSTPAEDLFRKLGELRHTRIPVCRGDVDDVAGVLYVQDVVRSWGRKDLSLESLLRPAVVVPESLTMDRLLERMREERTQILIVVDEYGGTSGIVTLEDIAEEVFGELEDRLETERPTIEVHPLGRVSARAEVRFDEVVEKLGVELEEEPATDTLATMFVDRLGRVPRLGDTIETPLGIMRIENMARSRITRVSIQLSRELQERAAAH